MAEHDIIPAEQARAILEKTMRATLGDDWNDEESGWQIVTGHDYMARVTRGRINIDFYVDLVGNITVEKKEINSAQAGGRTFAVVLLLLSLAIAYLMARAVGWL